MLSFRMGPTALHNEFFTKASVEWTQRLAEGKAFATEACLSCSIPLEADTNENMSVCHQLHDFSFR